ncbi:three-helix bundle dimerization domain-containing protein [Intrasporangium oryzae]|nr:hypothetical protein [Intrasporangium oryzae]
MDEDEAKAIHDVQHRLRAKFPHLDPDRVDAAVSGAHASMTGPIRSFVPVLVEHAARDELARDHP